MAKHSKPEVEEAVHPAEAQFNKFDQFQLFFK